MTEYTDILIDFDDTLYDTHGNADLALREVYEQFRLDRYFDRPDDFCVPYWQTNVELWKQYAHGEITRDYLIVERFLRPLSLGKGLEPTAELCLQISDSFLEFCSNKPNTIAGAHDLMQYLQSRGYRMHIASNGFHEVQYRKLRASRMLDYFATVVLSEDAGANKPSPQFFDYAMKVTAANLQRTILIGDNLDTDITGARNAGLPQIWFNPHGQTNTKDFTPTFEVRALEEIKAIL